MEKKNKAAHLLDPVFIAGVENRIENLKRGYGINKNGIGDRKEKDNSLEINNEGRAENPFNNKDL